MGLGDQLIATGMARGAQARGKRIAFGDGKRIRWDHNSPLIFKNNPNIAPPGSERDPDIEWNPYRKGNRIYQRHDVINNRWIWNYEFRAKPGEVFFDEDERVFASCEWQHRRVGQQLIVIEPDVPVKMHAINKRWPIARYQAVADYLTKQGFDVVRFIYGKEQIPFPQARSINTPTFRHALALLARSALYIGPEGGLHHGAAAVGIPAVVLFGDFIPPQVTGYSTHTNLTGASGFFCGSLSTCRHCRDAMQAIGVEEVVKAAIYRLQK